MIRLNAVRLMQAAFDRALVVSIVGEELVFEASAAHLRVEPVEARQPDTGILTRQACLLSSLDGRTFEVAASFDKDAWPMPWFKFGSLSLPSGHYSSKRFWLSGEGVRGLDGGSDGGRKMMTWAGAFTWPASGLSP